MWRLMLQLTPVAVIAMSINSINTFVDALFIGQFLGENALAGVSLAFPLSLIVNAFSAMLGVGGSSLLSIAIGAKDEDTPKKIWGVCLLMAICISIVLMILGWFMSDELIAAIGGEGEVLAFGSQYFKVLILGAIVQIFAVAMNFFIRAEGKLKTAMSMTIASVLLNMALNPIFIGYLGMGVTGAALATIIAMSFLMLMGLWYFLSKRTSYEVDFSYIKFDPKIVKPILAVGVSAMMLQVMFLIQNVVVFKMVSIYGDDWDIAFMGACYRILMLMIVPSFGFSSAVQPVIGINYGAGQYERVKRAYYVFGAGCVMMTIILLVGFELFPNPVLSLLMPNSTFSPDDIFHFRLRMLPTFLSSFFVISIILYQSIGKAKISGVMTVLREIVFFVPVVILLPKWLGLTGIYAAPLFQNLTVFVIIFILIYKLMNELSRKAEEQLESKI